MTKKIILALFTLIIFSLLILNDRLGQTFKHGPTQYTNTGEYQIVAMAVDKSGRVWSCAEQGDTKDSNHIIVFHGGEIVTTYELTDTDSGKCRTVTIAPNGNVLVGYDYGLVKEFDGKSWKTLLRKIPNITIITTLAVDHSGKIWVGSFEDGISVYDGNFWVSYRQDNSPLTQEGSIDLIVFDEKNRAWIGEGDSFYIFDGKHWQIFEISEASIVFDRNGQGWDGKCCVETIVFDKDGRAWIGQQMSVIVFDDGNLTRFTSDNSGLVSVGVREISFDDQGRAWIMQGRYGRNMFSIYNGESWEYYFAGNIHENSEVVEVDENGEFWLAYPDKLMSISPNAMAPVSKSAAVATFGLFAISGGIISIVIALVFILISYAVNIAKIVWVGFGVGALISVFSLLNAFSSYVAAPWFGYSFNFGLAALGFDLIIGGAIGGFVGKTISKSEKPNRERLCIVLGWVISLMIFSCSLLPYLIGQ